ncbi:acid protease [Lojkania enalia]|uniref:Acid protease n=1 Tax=Lojkania enalia TaxID=147567 RepID=A0A9P4JZU2_9PLEO|nr:acid protease [Didymosphaeria enalia]
MFLTTRDDSTNTTVIPAPFIFQPSTKWDGNDGKWSSFTINIGDDASGHGQNFRVLISTSFSPVLVPSQAEWCNFTCAANRGVEIFDQEQPRGFIPDSVKEKPNYHSLNNIPLPLTLDWWPEKDPNGTYYQANVGLGLSSKASYILEEQYVISYKSKDFFMGIFGLGNKAIQAGDNSKFPFLPNFADANNGSIIPSESYGYTAGAHYQNDGKGVLGSLVLGGFDQSRFSEQNTTISIANDASLLVGVQGIGYRPDPDIDPNEYSFPSGFLATIDSTLPYLWLPDEVCDQFAQRFRLTYDEDRNMYTVNDTAHNLLLNATFIIKIGKNTRNSDDATSIELPYAAFDLEADYPIFDAPTRYFPIKKSSTGVYVLGRTFLQEAYVIVDYERNEFKIARANWSDPMPESRIVSIFATDYVAPSPSATILPNGGEGGGISNGAIAGIVVGIVGAFVLGVLAFFLYRRNRDKRRGKKEKETINEIDTTKAGNEIKDHHELESEIGSPKGPGGFYAPEGDKFPPLEMSPNSTAAELYSPPPESMSQNGDYFSGKPRRRGATRESSANNTPGTPPLQELPGDDGQFVVGGQHFEPVLSPTQSPTHSRGPSDTSIQTNIDERIAASKEQSEAAPIDRRPSMHQRGPSDAPTIQSESTAVSNPTSEELNRWREEDEEGTRRERHISK